MTAKQPGGTPRGWPATPTAGVCMHITSLPSPHGIGDIAEASLAFLDLLSEMKLGVWQTLPTGPTGFGDSPYQALSAFAGNELLVGLQPLMQEGWIRKEELAPLERLPRGRVDYQAVNTLKWPLLRLAAQRFLESAANDTALGAFHDKTGEAWLDDYALYRVIKRHHGEISWIDWPAPLAQRDPGALARFAAEHERELAEIRVIQFWFERQWRALRRAASRAGITMFGDLPFYLAYDSADTWAGRELLELDEDGRPTRVAGVPPDYFSDDGQLWGNPLYHWQRHAENGFDWWIARLEAAASRHDLLRIDHFRGFESYWAIPANAETAREGQWCAGPGDALFDTLRNALGELPVVAEDLGIITDAVTGLRQRHAIPGMRVLQFELADPGFSPADIAEDCVCYTATHDNDTTAGWFSARPASRQAAEAHRKARRNALRLSGGSAQTIHDDLLKLAQESPARVALAPMQDYLGLGSEARLNTPGKASGNWRWRMLANQPEAGRVGEIAAAISACGRAPG